MSRLGEGVAAYKVSCDVWCVTSNTRVQNDCALINLDSIILGLSLRGDGGNEEASAEDGC